MTSIADFLLPDGLTLVSTEDQQPTLPAWPSRIEHLSASSIGMFRRCPEQFRHRYILGEKERPGESITVGSFFHEALGWNYIQKIDSHEDRPTPEIVEYLQDVAVPKVLEENGGADEIAWDSNDPVKGVDTGRKDSERMIVAYHRDVTPRIQPISVEQKFLLDVPGMPVPLLGYIDTETDDNRVLDVKTGKNGAKKMKPAWMLQATIYSAARGLDVEYHTISRGATPSITTGLESPDLIVRPNLVQATNVFRTAKMVADTIAWMYATYGPDQTWPTFGRFADWSMNSSPCKSCGWRRVCPAMQGET